MRWGRSAAAPRRFLRSASYSDQLPMKENHLAVAFKGQDMGGDAVQEPAVVADHHGTAAEIFQGFFQRPQGVDVQVVGRLVQEDDVGRLP